MSAFFPSQSPTIWVLQPCVIVTPSLGMSLYSLADFYLFNPLCTKQKEIQFFPLALLLVQGIIPCRLTAWPAAL